MIETYKQINGMYKIGFALACQQTINMILKKSNRLDGDVMCELQAVVELAKKQGHLQ